MNPLSQLFGILVEKMPGFMEPAKGWSSDPDKAIGQREALAGELLFKRGLQRCCVSAARDFITKLGGTSVASKRAPPSIKEVIKVGTGGTVKQGLMDSFLKDTALIDDQRLAKGMRMTKNSIRAASTKNQKTPI